MDDSDDLNARLRIEAARRRTGAEPAPLGAPTTGDGSPSPMPGGIAADASSWTLECTKRFLAKP